MTAAQKVARDKYLKRTYGISLDEYEAILTHQGGGCAVCQRQGVTRALAVDHDHKTGLVRGILCPRHNSGLQKFSDNPDHLAAATIYLVEPPAQAIVGARVAPVKPKRRRRRRKGRAK